MSQHPLYRPILSLEVLLLHPKSVDSYASE
jgi:hypothetical protein